MLVRVGVVTTVVVREEGGGGGWVPQIDNVTQQVWRIEKRGEGKYCVWGVCAARIRSAPTIG